MALDLVHRLGIDQRALADASLKTVADLDFAGLAGELADEFVIHPGLHINSIGANAGLAGVAVFADHRTLDR